MAIQKTELEKLVRALRTALTILEAELEPVEIPPEIQQEVARKMAARICLAWDHAIPVDDEDHRGLCSTDYATTMARIRRGEESEVELMKQGKLARKASQVDQLRKMSARSGKPN